jgi:hypothetical protein
MRNKLRWLLVGLGIVLVVTIAGWSVWNAVAGTRMRAAMKDMESRRVPMRLEDVRLAPVPDEQNAALLLNRAFLLMAGGKTGPDAQMASLTGFESFWKKDPRKGVSAEDAVAIRALLDSPEIREILDFLHRAGERPSCDFGLDYSKGAEMPLPHLDRMRMAVRLLALESWSRAAGGDAAGAIKAARCGLRIGGFGFSDGVLISFLVAASSDALTLNWAGVALGQMDPAAVPAAELEALSAQLAARRAEVRPAFVRALDLERLGFGVWTFEGLLSNRLRWSQLLAHPRNGPPQLGQGAIDASVADSYAWLGRPLLKGDYAAYLGLMMRYQEMAAKPFEPTKMSGFEELLREVPRSAILTRIAVPAYETCYKVAGEYEALLDVARLGVVLEMHRARTGAYPAHLADMSGIGALARDPCSGGELMYRPNAGGCRVWSVGADGKDDGGVRKGGGAKAYDIVWEVERAGH